ncbi:MAG: cardiolipin synthase [Oscillibacter sp.]|jgi:cardiolipin synthase|nr:cardiolipin synthase [Oscillibacter sp.]
MARKIQQKTERRISAAASIALCVMVVAIQIATTLLLTFFLHQRASYVYGALELVGALIAVWIYTRSGSPSYKLSWMCLLLALPVAGMLLFCLWGGTHQAKTLSLKRVAPPKENAGAQRTSAANEEELRCTLPEWGRLAAYLKKRGFLVYGNTSSRYFGDGLEFLEDLIAHMARAETYIFIEYYILAEGRVWDRMFRVLRERAAAGVEIRIIFDDFGNITRLSDTTLQEIQNAGIEVEVFNPVHRYVNRIYFNYRDHRKIAVIDGCWAYTGGINIADEYANLINKYGHWKDSGVRLEGAGAWGLAAQFIQMWKMIGRTLPNEDDYYRPRRETAGEGWCQSFTDGPVNNPDSPIEETYLQLIGTARRTLYITTPYYAVEESMQKALCIAADAGVDVRMVIPEVPDHKLTYLVAETYWGQLISHGVRIYKYTPGFIHAKSVMADQEVALVGSTNMDYRTFQLHYECGVLLYGMPAVRELEEDLLKTMGESRLYTLEEWNKRPWYRRAFASLVKLFAIWL